MFINNNNSKFQNHAKEIKMQFLFIFIFIFIFFKQSVCYNKFAERA
jgi:hypothetical protein